MALPFFGFLERSYRHAQRYRQILAVLFKYGFADLVENLGLDSVLDGGLKGLATGKKAKIEALTRPERMRLALEELGPTFIKFGQILSTRPDLLPPEFVIELERLQDDVPPFAYSQAREILQTELAQALEKRFASIEEKPLASASLGQVHRGQLRTGETVAVKVQRPDILEIIQTDMEIMMHLASLLENHVDGWEVHSPTRIVAEMTYTVKRELDYSIEAAHMNRFTRTFGKEPELYIPKVYPDLSTSRVLTMEYIPGARAADPATFKRPDLDRQVLADNLATLIMKQVFESGFFHADLHPGNIYFLPGNVVCFLDFGMMGRIDVKTREDFAELIIAIARRDEAEATRAVLRLTQTIPDEDDPDLVTLQRDVGDFMDQYFYRPLKEMDLGKLLQDLLQMVSRHRLRFPAHLFMMLRSLTAVESLCKSLDPEFDLVKRAEPFVRLVKLHRFSPGRISEEALASGMEFLQLIRKIPVELRDFLAEAKRGNLRLDFKHRGLLPIVETYERASKRIAFSVVLAALIIGSGLIILAGIPPRWFGIPVIGIAGFLFAGVMGFWLFISILRRGGM